MAGFAVELDELDTGLGAHGAHGGFGEGGHGVGERRAPVLGYDHQVGVQQRHVVPGVAVVVVVISLSVVTSTVAVWVKPP